ncbi:MAG: SLC13 family permease [Clostridiales bacterium]|nr:SLC13 family permease [Clostridiales bacterium]
MDINSGVIALIVFGVMITLWCIDKLPIAFVAMAGCVTCVLLKICTLPVAMSGFTNDLVFLVAGMEIVGIALLKSGLANVVGQAVLKASKNDERRLMIISFCIAAVMSAFMSNMTVVVLFIVIFRGAVKVSENINIKNITIPVIAGAVVGGACTLVGSTPQLAGQAVIEKFQGMDTFKLFDFTPVGIPIAIVTGLFIFFYAYPHGKEITAQEEAAAWSAQTGAALTGVAQTEATQTGATQAEMAAAENAGTDLLQPAADQKKLLIMAGISILMMLMMVTEFVSVGTAAMIAALLSMTTGCVTQKQAFSEMNWNIVIWLAGCFGIAEIMSVSGGTAILTSAIASVVSEGMPPFLFFALVTLVCMILTQLISNTACVLIFLPIFLSMATVMGISPYPIAMGVIYGSSLAYLTPLASAQIGLALTVGHRFKEIFRYGLLVHVVMYMAIITMVPIIYPL